MSRREKVDYIARTKRKWQRVVRTRRRSGNGAASSVIFSCNSSCSLVSLFKLITIALVALSLILVSVPATCQQQLPAPSSPQPLPGASHVTLNGLALVVVFDKPVNLSASIESVEQRLAAAAASGAYDSSVAPQMEAEQSVRAELKQRSTASERGPSLAKTPAKISFGNRRARQKRRHNTGKRQTTANRRQSLDELLQAAASDQRAQSRFFTCQKEEDQLLTSQPIGGIQLCAQLLTRKTLRQLRSLKLFNCVWASQAQFIIQLGSAAPSAASVRLAFARGTIADSEGRANERELVIELSKLPLEGMAALSGGGGGAAQLAPRLALTGPSQVPVCGQFSLSAHLSSPYGTRLGESVQFEWSVERVGLVQATSVNETAGAGPQRPPLTVPPIALAATNSEQQAQSAAGAKEQRWQALKQVVASQRSNNLLLDSSLMEFLPQQYEFKLSTTFISSLTSFKLNASHQVGRLDFDAPIGSIFGTHMLAAPSSAPNSQQNQAAADRQPQQLQQQLNTNHELVLMADIQVPECASNIKQVGLYWQVSDPRVRFEQTFAPYYLAKPGTLPEQALVEFRLNLFYGIRVKKFASASALISTGDSVLDAQISNGLLTSSVGQDVASQTPSDQAASPHQQQQQAQLELHAEDPRTTSAAERERYTFQWSCFDGRTAQVCARSQRLAQSNSSLSNRLELATGQPQSQPLVDRARARQSTLRLPLGWLEPDAQLWFGLQRFERQNPSQQSRTEYALVSVQPLDMNPDLEPERGGARRARQPPSVSIGPVLVGQQAGRWANWQRQDGALRATLRNPLTGAIILLEQVPVLVVGRLRPASKLEAFSWRIPNYAHPLHWTVRNRSEEARKGDAGGDESDDELVTELHLSPELLVAYSNHQVQLVACWNRQVGAQSSVASISLDVIQSVTECRVELSTDLIRLAPLASAGTGATPTNGGASASVQVNYCNIPLGLSPLTYQLYLIDTSSVDSLIESSRPRAENGSSSSSAASTMDNSEFLNEADELFLDSQAQPLTLPQLSPVFPLGSLASSAMGTLLDPGPAGTSNGTAPRGVSFVRFAARVCHRLASCKMFFSGSVNLVELMGPILSGQPTSSQAFNVRQRAQQQDDSFRGLRRSLESARRANTAGNSVAAIGVLNSVMQLAERNLHTNQQLNAWPSNEPGATSSSKNEQMRELLQLATRDCLHYGAQSLQRQFHYTDGGQANLVLSALGRILLQRQSSLEAKFRAMRLMAQLVSRKLIEQPLTISTRALANGSSSRSLSLVSLSLPDFKSIQSSFEALFSPTVFTQHSLGSAPNSARHQDHNKSPASAAALRSNATLLATQQQQQQLAGLLTAAASSSASASPSAGASGATRAGRKGREEAILMYLRAIRQAHRALLQAAALQLSLGAVQQFEYQQQNQQAASLIGAGALGGAGGAGASGDEASTGSSNRIMQTRLAQQAPVDIVSSLTHQTDLLSDNIEVDLHDFGSVSINFGFEQAISSDSSNGNSNNNNESNANIKKKNNGKQSNVLGNKLAQALAKGHLRCRNDTTSHPSFSVSGGGPSGRCSSFVLALTSFAGRAPFRALSAVSASLLLQNEEANSKENNNNNINEARPQQQLLQQGSAAPLILAAPIIQVDWLSPVDGSNLIELLRHDQEQQAATERSPLALRLDDFKASVTFIIPELFSRSANEQTAFASSSPPSSQQQHSTTSARDFKCFQFDESTNEWIEAQELASPSLQTTPRTFAVNQPSSVADDSNDDESGGSRASQTPGNATSGGGGVVVRCSFKGYGAIGVFQGRPPAAKRSVELTIAMGLGALLLLVSLFMFLGCFASKVRDKRQAHSGSTSSSASASTTGSPNFFENARPAAYERSQRVPKHLVG